MIWEFGGQLCALGCSLSDSVLFTVDCIQGRS